MYKTDRRFSDVHLPSLTRTLTRMTIIIFKEQHNWNRIYCFSSKTVHIVVYCTNIYVFITPIDRLNILIGDWCNNYFAQIFVDGRKNYFTPGAFNKSKSSSSAKQPCGETNIFEATLWGKCTQTNILSAEPTLINSSSSRFPSLFLEKVKFLDCGLG